MLIQTQKKGGSIFPTDSQPGNKKRRVVSSGGFTRVKAQVPILQDSG